MPAPPELQILAQPFGSESVGERLASELEDGDWASFRASVAFLKQSGLQHVAAPLHSFLSTPGHNATISVGIDHDGTSLEGLQNLWRTMNGRGQLYVFKEGQGSLVRTFHPKAYAFERDDEEALVLVGSSNLTQGGLFGNHEASVVIHLDLTDQASSDFWASLVSALDRWQSPGAACRRVDAALIQELWGAGDLISEVSIAAAARAARAATRRGSAASTAGRPPRFGSSGAAVLPPPPPALPPMAPLIVTPSSSPSTVSARPVAPRPLAPAVAPPTAHQTLLIEVRPHHNGEVFLSKLAVNEDPGFFGFPFSGWATPKSTTPNPVPYPMASPDPQVEIVVHDHRGRAVITMRHALNVVYYSRKHEIRITIPPEPLGRIPEMSLLVMTRNPAPTLDYRLEFYPPTCNTLAVRALRAKLTTALPSGGSPQRRHYGWA